MNRDIYYDGYKIMVLHPVSYFVKYTWKERLFWNWFTAGYTHVEPFNEAEVLIDDENKIIHVTPNQYENIKAHMKHGELVKWNTSKRWDIKVSDQKNPILRTHIC